MTGDQLRRYLADRLPGYMVPAAIVEIDRIPLTPNQKVDLAALPDPPEPPDPPPDGIGQVPHGDPVAESVAAIWRKVLAHDQLRVDDNFFEVGGDSLALMRVLTQLRRQIGATVTVHRFLQRPTIGALAAAIRDDLDA